MRSPLEPYSSDPLYRQVAQQILRCLARGEWKPGEQLPTEIQLAERFGVAVFTVRAGISELVAAQILLRAQGKGTFVARHSRQRERNQFSRVYGTNGERAAPERELLSFVKGVAAAEAAAALDLPAASRSHVYTIACLLGINGAPAGTLDIVIPATRFPGLTAKAVRECTDNLYSLYQNMCGVNVIRMDERVCAAAASARIARALKIAAGTPILRIERIAYTYHDTPVEYRIRQFPGDAYHYLSSERGGTRAVVADARRPGRI